jgi:hypothetical protein
LTVASPVRGQSAEFNQIQTALKRMAPAPTAEEIARSRRPETAGRYPDDARMEGTVQPPSTRYRTVDAGGLFQVSVPSNWKEFRDGSSVTFAPDGAYGNVQGQSVFTHGAIVGMAQASSRDLARESDRFVSGILDGNAYLNVNSRYQRLRIDGYEALRIRLTGTSPVTKRTEIVDVYTALTERDALFTVIQVVPSNDQRAYSAAFNQMVRTARVS